MQKVPLDTFAKARINIGFDWLPLLRTPIEPPAHKALLVFWTNHRSLSCRAGPTLLERQHQARAVSFTPEIDQDGHSAGVMPASLNSAWRTVLPGMHPSASQLDSNAQNTEDWQHQQAPSEQFSGQPAESETDCGDIAGRELYRKPWRAGSRLGEQISGNAAEQGIVHADPAKLKLLLG